MRTADSVVLDSAFARQFIFSTGKWTPADSFVRAETVAELVAYARERTQAQERLTIRSVQFNYWRGNRELHFGPVVFERSARDLTVSSRTAVGKGMYLCGEGLRVLNLGRPGSS
jgi:hypothetical protein